MTIRIDVKSGGIESAFTERPFDEAKAELEGKGYDIISLEQFAQLRIAQGKDSHVANWGAYTREGFLYVPQKGMFLVRNSPIMTNAKEATECHRRRRVFYLTNEQAEEALKDSIKFNNSNSIPTNRFIDDERTAYAFGKTAEVYGNFLKEAGISEMPFWLASIGTKPFATQAWLHWLGDGDQSGLFGFNYNLYCNVTVRGVRNI